VLVAEVVAAAAEPEEEEEEEEEGEEAVLATLAEDEEVDILPEDTPVDWLDTPDVLDPAVLVTEPEAAAALTLETEAELYNDSLLALLEALILLMTSATVLAAVPLAVKGVAEPARQVVISKPTLMPVRPSFWQQVRSLRADAPELPELPTMDPLQQYDVSLPLSPST
jgi:hypothetical protein